MKTAVKIKETNSITLPKSQYAQFLRWQELEKKRLIEKEDTDQAIAGYMEAKKKGKLKVLRSFKALR
ncbi:MAG: hypothetical protein AAB455_00025 [Patescibacteria group bacterium]